MKIIVVAPISNGMYKDDTTMFCEGFRKYHGAEVVKIAEHEEITDEFSDADVVWAPYEPLIPKALEIKEKFGIPVVGHFEMVPLTRLPLDVIDGQYVYHHTYAMSEYHKKYYHFAQCYNSCDAKTYIDDYHLINVERLLGEEITDVTKKLYPQDKEMLQSFKDYSIEEKRQIVSISRLVNIKKIHHVIKALSLLDNPPLYIVVGHGNEKSRLEKMAHDLGVEVNFVGMVSDEEKAKIIQESMFAVNLWAWLPIGECAFYNKVSITYDHPATREKMGDMPFYVRLNDTKDLSDTIELLSTVREDSRKARGVLANSALEKDCTDIVSVEKAAENMYKIFESVI